MLGRFAEPFVPCEQELAKRLRKVVARSEVVDADQLFDEERDTLAELVDPVDSGCIGRAPEDLLRLRRDLGPVEAPELPAHHASRALELRQVGTQRMPAQHLIAAVAEHDQDLSAGQHADQEADELEGGCVGPVDVFDDDDELALPRDVLEQHRDEFVEAFDARARRHSRRVEPLDRAQLGKEHRQRAAARAGSIEERTDSDVVCELPEDAGERRVRSPVSAEIDAPPRQDERRTRCLRPEFVEQARLADAGLSTHDDGPRRPLGTLRELFTQRLEIGFAPDHGGARRR